MLSVGQSLPAPSYGSGDAWPGRTSWNHWSTCYQTNDECGLGVEGDAGGHLVRPQRCPEKYCSSSKREGRKSGRLVDFSRADVYEVLRATIVFLKVSHGPIAPIIVDGRAGVVDGDDAGRWGRIDRLS